MIAYVWPAALIVLSNVMYQICAKGLPSNMDPLASMVITYGVSTIFSFILFMTLSHGSSISVELQKTNWAPFVLGLVIVGLEVGFLYGYKNGWQVSALPLVTNTILAILLIFVGFLLYKEQITWEKLAGVAICLVGLYFINKA